MRLDSSDKKPDYSDRDPLTQQIIAACYQVHNELGPGFIEKIYLNALKVAFKKMGLNFQEEKEFEVLFGGEKIGKFRADLVVENKVIVELKSIESKLPKIFESQVISYLKASDLRVGLLINFGRRRCEIRRLMLSP